MLCLCLGRVVCAVSVSVLFLCLCLFLFLCLCLCLCLYMCLICVCRFHLFCVLFCAIPKPFQTRNNFLVCGLLKLWDCVEIVEIYSYTQSLTPNFSLLHIVYALSKFRTHRCSLYFFSLLSVLAHTVVRQEMSHCRFRGKKKTKGEMKNLGMRMRKMNSD